MAMTTGIRAGSAYIELMLNDSKFAKGLKNAAARFGKFAGEMQRMGQQMFLAGSAITTPFVGASIVFADFESNIKKATTLLSEAARGPFDLEATMSTLTEEAKRLGETTTKTASDVADGMRQMAQMGFTVDEIMTSIKAITSAAEISGLSMAQQAEITIQTINALGESVDNTAKVIDMMAKTSTTSAATITDLGNAVGYLSGTSSTANEPIEDVLASLSIMADNAIQGERSGTSLRGAFLQLADAPPKAKEALRKMKIELLDANDEFIGMRNLLAEFERYFAGTPKWMKAKQIAEIFDLRQSTGQLALLSMGLEEFDARVAQILDSRGAADRIAKAFMDTLKGSFTELMSAINTFAIDIGESVGEMMRPVIDILTLVIREFRKWMSRNKNLVKWIFGIGAGLMALGAALMAVAVAAKLIAFVFGGLVTVMGVLATTISMVLTPWGMLVALIVGSGGIVAAIIALNDGWKSFKDQFSRDISPIVATFQRTILGIKKAIEKGDLQLVWKIAGKGMELAFYQAQETITANMQKWFDRLMIIVVDEAEQMGAAFGNAFIKKAVWWFQRNDGTNMLGDWAAALATGKLDDLDNPLGGKTPAEQEAENALKRLLRLQKEFRMLLKEAGIDPEKLVEGYQGGDDDRSSKKLGTVLAGQGVSARGTFVSFAAGQQLSGPRSVPQLLKAIDANGKKANDIQVEMARQVQDAVWTLKGLGAI